ncbi:MAG: hypothetical protein ACJ788_01950 [Ktedonobacteraceae bacterium]|jgi:hypothetical protein
MICLPLKLAAQLSEYAYALPVSKKSWKDTPLQVFVTAQGRLGYASE